MSKASEWAEKRPARLAIGQEFTAGVTVHGWIQLATYHPLTLHTKDIVIRPEVAVALAAWLDEVAR